MSEEFVTVSGIAEQLDREGFLLCPNKGTSMLPLIRQGRDIMRIDRIVPEEVRLYDAVLFRRGEQFVLHRVVRCSGERFYIRGDNTLTGEWVQPEKILGRLTEVLRDGKRRLRMDSPAWRVYARAWTWGFPIRYVAVRGLRLIHKVYKKACMQKKKADE